MSQRPGEKRKACDGVLSHSSRCERPASRQEQEWMIESIVHHRMVGGREEVLVNWDPTWEPKEALEKTAAWNEYQAQCGMVGGTAGDL